MRGERLAVANRIAERLWRKYHPGVVLLDRPRKILLNPYTGAPVTYVCCLGSYRKVRKPCSCPGCGNPRRHFGEITLQEKRHIEAWPLPDPPENRRDPIDGP